MKVEYNGTSIELVDDNGIRIAEIWRRGDNEKEIAISNRIVACFNACVGIPDDILLGAKHYGVDPLKKRIDDLEQFLRDDVKDALIDLQNYIDNSKWTRSQQAEHDDCVMMIEKLDKLCGTT